MRTLLTTLFAAIMIAVVGIPTGAEAARVDTLIKGSGPTIYWAARDGKKYTFPNIATYYTWFTSNDFRLVKKISDKELKAIPTAGNVTYRGGAKLVKFPNESTVYAVSRYSVLRPILNPQVATQLYGAEWTRLIETIPWTLRGDYRIGSTIRAAYEYSASIEYNGVKTPSDNIGNPNFNPLPPVYPPEFSGSTLTGNVDLAFTNRFSTPVDRAQFVATVSGANRNANQLTIEIKNVSRNEVIKTCYASYTCSTEWYVDTVAAQEIIAIVKDGSGYSLGSNRVTVPGRAAGPYYPPYGGYTPYVYPYAVELSLSSNSVQKQDQVTAYVKTSNTYYNRLATLEIYVDNVRIGTCQQTDTCTLTFNNPTANVTREVYARAFDAYGTVRESARQTVYVSDRVDAWTQGSFWADRRLDAEWVGSQTLRLTGRITNSNRETQNLRLTIIDTSTNHNVKHCVGTDYCTVDVFVSDQWINTARYALLAFDMNGQELGYVYAPTIPGNNAYTPTATTEASIVSHDRTTTMVNVTGYVSGAASLTNTRLEIYTDIYSDLGGQFQQPVPTRLVNTCYNTSTCSIQDRTNTTYYRVSYYTVFVDANGQRTTSAVYRIN